MDIVGKKLLDFVRTASVGTLGENSAALEDAVTAKAAAFLESRDETKLFQVKEFAPELHEWGEANCSLNVSNRSRDWSFAERGMWAPRSLVSRVSWVTARP